MKIDNKKIEEIINNRLIDKIYPSKDFLEKFLKSKKVFTIYHGVDPTAPSLHLGHSTNYFLLKKFQELGHKIILLIGDFTAQIGDPTDKLAARKSLTKKEVLENCKTYKKQLSKILDFSSKKNPAKIKFNSKWFSKLNFEKLIKLAAHFTVSQMLQRDMFQKRLADKKEIYLHEFLYPLMQGYDSVALDADIEIGGTDQTFNMLIGRDLVKKYNNKEKFIITTPLLVNPKTNKKLMSKSEGGYVGLDDSSNEMYGKIMALSDEVIIPCFNLCTSLNTKEIEEIKKDLKNKKKNQRDIKAKLAREIVAIYHDEKLALRAEQEFNKVFKEKKTPSKIPIFKQNNQRAAYNLIDLLVETKLAPSRTEAKRLIAQKAIKIDNEVQKDWQKEIKIIPGMIMQAGKRKFIKF
ncbi:tyrosine--tRNA ligase [Patescibacteria group bacterium]|nr:tyrosine--tRNA ligase [Patescibacteria group bacterium]